MFNADGEDMPKHGNPWWQEFIPEFGPRENDKVNTMWKVSGDVIRFIDFQHVKRASIGFDITTFLCHSVSTEWRRENELDLLSLYYDAIVENEGYTKWVKDNPEQKLTWEVFLLNVQFCLYYNLNRTVVFAATRVAAYQYIDPRRFLRGGTFMRRFLETWRDWGPKEDTFGWDEEDWFKEHHDYKPGMQRVLEAAAKRSEAANKLYNIGTSPPLVKFLIDMAKEAPHENMSHDQVVAELNDLEAKLKLLSVDELRQRAWKELRNDWADQATGHGKYDDTSHNKKTSDWSGMLPERLAMGRLSGSKGTIGANGKRKKEARETERVFQSELGVVALIGDGKLGLTLLKAKKPPFIINKVGDGSLAAKAKIEAGWSLIAVGDVNVEETDPNSDSEEVPYESHQVGELLKKAKGKGKVTLTIRRVKSEGHAMQSSSGSESGLNKQLHNMKSTDESRKGTQQMEESDDFDNT